MRGISVAAERLSAFEGLRTTGFIANAELFPQVLRADVSPQMMCRYSGQT